jgi:hypothetical protein
MNANDQSGEKTLAEAIDHVISHLQGEREALPKKLTKETVSLLVQATRTALTEIFVFDVPEVYEFLEASCAPVIFTLVERGGESHLQWNSLKTLQKNYLINLIGNIHEEFRKHINDPIKNTFSRKNVYAMHLIGAALYRPVHNDGEAEETIRLRGVLKKLEFQNQQNESVTCEVMPYELDTQSEEYQTRVCSVLEKESKIANGEDIPINDEGILDLYDHQPAYPNMSVPSTTSANSSPTVTASIMNYFQERNELIFSVQTLYHRLATLSALTESDRRQVDVILPQLASIERALAPKRIAVVGEVSAGKSTFLSHLLGHPGLFMSGCSAVTSVMTEIHFVPSTNYKVQFIYSTQDDLDADIEYYKKELENQMTSDSEEENDDNNEDIRFETILNHLRHYFQYVTTDHSINFNSPKLENLQYIGHPVEEITGDLETIKLAMKTTVTMPSKLASLNLIRIQGPFEHLPPGVVLLDTPGLGDGNEARSQTTIDGLNQFQGVWYATSVGGAMSKEWDQMFLKKIIQMENLKNDIQIVATKADDEEKRSEDTLDIYDANILRTIQKDYLIRSGIKPKYLIGDIVNDHVKTLPLSIQQSLIDRASLIPVRFTSVQDNSVFGFEEWHRVCETYGVEMQDTLNEQKKIFNALLDKCLMKVGITGRNMERSLLTEFDKAKKEFLAAIANIYAPSDSYTGASTDKMIDDLTTMWNNLNTKPNTRKAIMIPHRAGKFTRKEKKTFKGCKKLIFDLNEDIAVEWQQALRPTWDGFKERVQAWEHHLAHQQVSGSLARNLSKDIIEKGKVAFEIDVKETIETFLLQQGIYALKRNSFPAGFELKDLLATIRIHIERIVEDMHGTLKSALHAVSTMSNSTGAVYELLSKFREDSNALIESIAYGTVTRPVPIEFTCRKSSELLERPVIQQCCWKVIDMKYAGENNCVLCGLTSEHKMELPALRKRINIWRQSFLPVPPIVGNWWEVYAEVGNKTSRRSNVDEDNNKDESHQTKKTKKINK